MTEELLTLKQFKQWLPEREKDSYKGDYGKALIIGGNAQMGGAVQMNAQAAVYGGCGLVTVASAKENLPAIHSSLPEVMFIDWEDTSALKEAIQQSEIIAIGSGMTGADQRLFKLLIETLKDIDTDKAPTVVIDAGVIAMYQKVLSEHEGAPPLNTDKIIFTPHLGEWRQLTNNEIDSEDDGKVQNFVNDLDAVVVLKGSETRIFAPGISYHYKNTYGNPGQAIGGMGDTLVGVLVAMLGTVKDPFYSAAAGVLLHSYTADRVYEKEAIVVPTRLAHELPRVLKELSA